MTFRVLGPVEVLRETGIAVPLPVGRARVVLAMLCAYAGQPVPKDTLIYAVWNGKAPASAATRIAAFISALRRALEPDAAVIGTRGDGYVLLTGPDDVDLSRLRRAIRQAREYREQGHDAEAAQRLREVLDLWRGAPFSGLGSAELDTIAGQLEQEHLSAVEEYAEVELAAGQHAAVAGVLARFAPRHLLRERLARCLIEALAGCGRQAEAIAVYHELRRQLADELGVDPGPLAQEAYQRVIAGDHGRPAPSASRAPVPRQLPAGIADFTGRDEMVGALTALLMPTAARPATLPIAAIAGPAGIGKSVLAIHVAHLVADNYPDGQLYLNLAGTSPNPAGPADVLARLLRDLGAEMTGLPAGSEELAARFRSMVAGKRLLLVADDARDSAQVVPLLPGSARCAVLVTSRARLADLAGAAWLDLPVLVPARALALFASIAGKGRVTAEPEAAGSVVRYCAGLPLAIRIVAAKVATRPGWTIANVAARLAAESDRLAELRCGDLAVRATFQLSFDSLGAAQARTFRLLGLAPPRALGPAAIAALAGTSPAEAERCLEDLAEINMLQSPSSGQYLLHDLLRLFASELAAAELTWDERAAAVRRLTGWYAAALRSAMSILAQGRRMPPGTYVESADPGWTVPVFTAHDDALGWVQEQEASLVWAIGTAAARGWHELALRLANLFGLYGARQGHPGAQIATQRVAAASAAELGDDFAEAWSLAVLGVALKVTGDYAGAISCHEQALVLRRRAGDRHGEAASYCNLGNAQRESNHVPEALESFRQAALICEEERDDLTLGMVLTNVGQTHRDNGDPDAGLTWLGRAVEVLQRTEDRFSLAVARTGVGEALFQTGRLERALAEFRAAETGLRELGVAQSDLIFALSGMALTLDALGRQGEADRCRAEVASLRSHTEAGTL